MLKELSVKDGALGGGYEAKGKKKDDKNIVKDDASGDGYEAENKISNDSSDGDGASESGYEAEGKKKYNKNIIMSGAWRKVFFRQGVSYWDAFSFLGKGFLGLMFVLAR